MASGVLHFSGASPRCFEHLLEAASEKVACKTMVELLAMAHERACEVELADALTDALAEGQLPDLDMLRVRFAPHPSALPEVVVELAPLSAYDALLTGEAA